MKLFFETKQKFLRGKLLSAILIIIFQIQVLAVFLTNNISQFYQSAFGIFLISSYKNVSIEGMYIVLVLQLLLYFCTIFASTTCNIVSQTFILFLPKLVKILPCILLIPIISYCLGVFSAETPDFPFYCKILAIINIVLALGWAALYETTNWSNRFLEKDYCNRRNTSYVKIVILLVCLIIKMLFGSIYGAFCFGFRAIFMILALISRYEFELIQKLDIFFGTFCLLNVVWIIIIQIQPNEADKNFQNDTFVMVLTTYLSYEICKHFTNFIVIKIWMKQALMKGSNDKQQNQSLPENQNNQVVQFQNTLRILVRCYIQSQKHSKSQAQNFKNGGYSNSANFKQNKNDFDKWWRYFYQRISTHKLSCQRVKCICRGKDSQDSQNNQQFYSKVYLHDLISDLSSFIVQQSKNYHLKILNIYMYNEIAKKPFKAYYQIMRLMREKVSLDVKIDLQSLIQETRQCFDMIFKKNKVQNQQLELQKVIEYEEAIDKLQSQLLIAIKLLINFLQMFTYSSIKLQSIEAQAKKISKQKHILTKMIENVVKNYLDNKNIQLVIFIFYKFVEMYKSRQSQFRKISNQQLLKNRIYSKSQVNIFSQQFGSIYIDLIEDRGKIKKITKNLCEIFGYSRDDMVSYNINLFMPRMFGRYHGRFLYNFIEKGQIRLLKEKERIVYGKNKKKFIFPINVRLKTQHLLQNQFGATALISSVKTNSDYIIYSNLGKVEEITEGLYQKVFQNSFKEQVTKINRLCIYKFMPSLVQKFSQKNTLQANKFTETIFLYTDLDDTLNQKFRYSKDNLQSIGSSIRNNPSTISGSFNINASSSLDHSENKPNESIENLVEIFKNFIIDLNIFRLRASKILYKTSKLKTAEFEIDLIEITNLKQMAISKESFLEIVCQLRKVSEMLGLNEQQNPVIKHLDFIQQLINEKNLSFLLSLKNFKSLSRETELDQQVNDKISRAFQASQQMISSRQKNIMSYQQNFAEEDSKSANAAFNFHEKKQANFKGRSEQSSLIGSIQNQSKKQMLINSFNAKDSGFSWNFLIIVNFIIVSIIIISVIFASMILTKSDQSLNHWEEISLILNIFETVEMRFAQRNLNNFYTASSISNPRDLKEQKLFIDEKLKNYATILSEKSNLKSLAWNLYANEIISLKNSIDGRIYTYNVMELINYMLWVFKTNDQQNWVVLLENYENIHYFFQNLKNLKMNQNNATNFSFSIVVYSLLGLYQICLLLLIIGAVPLIKRFKQKQKFLLSLLVYINQKQIRKSIVLLKTLAQYMAITTQKLKENKIQNELGSPDDPAQRENQHSLESATTLKTLKIAEDSESEHQSMCNYCAIILSIGFLMLFSLFSATMLGLFIHEDKFVKTTIEAYEISSILQSKPSILINIYLANAGRVLQNKDIQQFSNSLYNESVSDYVQILDRLTNKDFNSNFLTDQILQTITESLCNMNKKQAQTENISSLLKKIQCPISFQNSSISILYESIEMRNKFAIWNPVNQVQINKSAMQNWIILNEIVKQLQWFPAIIYFSFSINQKINYDLNQHLEKLKIIMVVLTSVLIPINMVLLIVFQYFFLTRLTKIVSQAEIIFMNFNVSVLVQNTYLTSYFNSKAKSNK